MKQPNSIPIPSCPTCGDPFESMTRLGGQPQDAEDAPRPGAILLCMTCGEICVLDERGVVQRMSEEEARTLSPLQVQMLATVEACRQTVAKRNGRNPFGREGGAK